ncbi:MAG TPA: Tim44 domain-containing protein [Candidatus Deferrimicrobiaceae bacterium]|jgi:predicted lipid-binding transport protein (Tim44 family)
MRRSATIFCLLLAAALFVLYQVVPAEARFGGGSRSFGSRGGRSLSPSSPSSTPYRSAPSVAPTPSPGAPASAPAPAPAGGGFLRSFGGGLAGGLLGGMLFGSLFGHGGGMGGCGGSGIGPFEILVVGGLGYLAYKMLFARKPEAPTGYSGPRAVDSEPQPPAASDWQQRYQESPGGGDVAAGIAGIRGLDPAFDAQRFCDDTATGLFFKVQGTFAARDVSPVAALLTPEVRDEFQVEAEALRARKQFNRLENIAMRKVEIVEAWQEPGQDYVTVLFRANLLDYVVDEAGALVSGSQNDPVLFEEYWTFTRPSGAGGWKLSAISQSA